MEKLAVKYDLPRACFHSIRHTSITYKLKLNGGDIKAVQGDAGHSQVKMVTERYAHILDESRVKNALLMEEAFYSGQKISPASAASDGNQAELEAIAHQREMEILLKDPKMLKHLKELIEMFEEK